MAIVVGIPGVQGPPGAAGSPGAPGASGNTMWPTSGAPSVSLGVNGDFANDPVALVMYGPKANGAWPAGVSYVGSPGPQGAPGANARWINGTAYNGFVAAGCACPTSNVDGGGTGNNAFNCRSVLQARGNITTIGVVLANFRVLDSNGGESGCGSNCTVHVAVEYPVNSGTCYQLTWGGNATGTLFDGTFGQSDIITLPITIPSGAQFCIREHRVYTSSFFGLPITGQSANPTALGACFEYGASTALSDRTLTPGSYASTSVGYHNTPMAVIGSTTLPSYAICGDSRSVGFGEFTIANTDPYSGFIERSIGPTRAYSNLGKVSETFSSVTTNGGYVLRQQFVQKYATHIIVAYGVNDIYANTTSVLALINTANQFRAMFPSKWAALCTIMTENESTDSWATTANQSFTLAKEVQRWQANNTMRVGGMPYYDVIYDPCKVLEFGGLNSSIWNVPGWTPDGTHMTVVGANAVANGAVFVNFP